MAKETRNRDEMRQQRLEADAAEAAQYRRQRLAKLGAAAIFAAIVIVVGAIVISQSGSSDSTADSGSAGKPTNLSATTTVENLLAGIPQNGSVLGNPSAKSTLIEYGDLQCPICKEYSETVVPQLISGPVKQGKAKIEFRNFTIIPPLSQSVAAGAAALAAGKQGKFWNYLELFYRNQGEEGSGYVTDKFMTAIAKGAGVSDIAKWNTDRQSAALIAEVKRTTAQANKAGFSGTPTFVATGPGGTKVLGTPAPQIGPFEAALSAVAE